jgi:hypothetical protein
VFSAEKFGTGFALRVNWLQDNVKDMRSYTEHFYLEPILEQA